MLPKILTPDLADPAWTGDAVGGKVGTVVVNGGLPAGVVGAAAVVCFELLPCVVGAVVVDTGVVVANDPGPTVPGTTVPGATVPGMTVTPVIPDTVIEPPTAKPAVAHPHTITRVSIWGYRNASWQ